MTSREFEEQARSGFRLALTFVGGFLVLVTLVKGMMVVEGGTLKGISSGVLIALIPIVILWLTVSYWAKWFWAVTCFFTLRALVMCLVGRTISVPSLAAPRIFFAMAAAAGALLALLSYRFVDNEPNRVDAICLIGALAACLGSLQSKSPLKWALPAIFFLGVCNVYDRFRAPRQIRKYPPRS